MAELAPGSPQVPQILAARVVRARHRYLRAMAGELLDVDVLDHIVLALGRFESMKSLKMGFS